MDSGVEFGATAVGILALICVLVLLFGRRGTRRLLGWGLGLARVGYWAGASASW
jgi:hypothetical protein